MIKVLIVNDSIMVQQLLKRIVESDVKLELSGIASDGFEGVKLVDEKKPDVVLMDIHMPKCDGVKATKLIMANSPRPVLIVTATITQHMPHIYNCLSSGALDVVKTPMYGNQVNNAYEKVGSELIKRIKIVHSISPKIKRSSTSSGIVDKKKVLAPRQASRVNGKSAKIIIAIGASMGGPNSILEVLNGLPANLQAGIVIVQHIDLDFASGLAEWFDASCDLKILSARKGDNITNGDGYLAAGEGNLIVKSGRAIEYQEAVTDAIYKPSIDTTFQSIADNYGTDAIGIILTGMGRDGAKGLKAIREAGGRTIAQDEATSIVYGMPRAAKDIKAAEFILPLNQISSKIVELL